MNIKLLKMCFLVLTLIIVSCSSPVKSRLVITQASIANPTLCKYVLCDYNTINNSSIQCMYIYDAPGKYTVGTEVIIIIINDSVNKGSKE